jgi:parvulin-like peptidyl-prolyl isomerase
MKPRVLIAASSLLLLPLGSTGRGQEATPSAGEGDTSSGLVVATVNGQPVCAEDVRQVLEQLHAGAASAKPTTPDRKLLMFRLVNDALLAQEARAMGIDREDPVPAQVARRRESLAVARLEKEEIASRARPSEEEVRRAFQDEYRTVTLRMLTVREQEKAADLRRRLEEGADFAALAKASSVDPYAARGGLVEGVAKIDLPLEIADQVFALKPGELAGPLVTRIGWTDIRVESVSAADEARYDELKPSLTALVRFRKAEALRGELDARMRQAHAVTVDEAAVAAIVPQRLPDGRLEPRVERPDLVVARVDDRAITAGQLARAFRMRWSGVANETAALAARGPVLDRLVRGELMAAEAMARGYGDTPEARRALRAYETRLLVSRYLNQVLAAEIRVTPEEMKAYYEAHREGFHRPPRVHVHQITVPIEEEASRLAGLLRQGADVGFLARQHSVDGFKDAGGDRGWVVPGRTGNTLDDALLTARPGEVLGPVASADGFCVLQVDAREEQGIYDFDEISGNVRKAVQDQKVEQAIDELVQKLRSRSKIELHEDVLDSLRITAAQAQETAHPGGPVSSPEPR